MSRRTLAVFFNLSCMPSLPEVLSAVDAGETLAVAADVHVFLYLGFFQGFTTTIAGEENHFNSASPRLHPNPELTRSYRRTQAIPPTKRGYYVGVTRNGDPNRVTEKTGAGVSTGS